MAKKCSKCGINDVVKGQRWCSQCRQVKSNPLRIKWIQMFRRCYDVKHYLYPTHGGIGIEVCDEWDDFATFEQWCLDNKWKIGMHLDRINPKGNYEPSNCHFITSHAHFAKTAHERIPKWVKIKHELANKPAA